jgi:proteasome lid subunit RPN8/RPN11
MDFYHLEDFLAQINHKIKMIDKKIKNFIKKQALESAPNECCGFIVKENDSFKCIPCYNIATDTINNFKIGSLEYLKIKNKYKIFYIYHSHTNENCDFSEMDKNCSENLNLPIILYNIEKNIFKVYEPISVDTNLIGRFYEYKKYDCFTLIRDFYLKKMNIDLSIEYEDLDKINVKKMFIDHYNDKNLMLINNIEELKDNDILLIDDFKEACHCAIYLGNDKILHQPMDTFSKIENYCNFYRRRTNLIFRSKI